MDGMTVVSRIRLKRKGLECFLSPLESDILKILWDEKHTKVRDIYNKLKGRRKVALTSVAVILDRLYKKKLVTRRVQVGRGGYHYIYLPRISENAFESSVVDETVNKLIENFGDVAINYFNERFVKKKEMAK